jgi:hypothetical protein
LFCNVAATPISADVSQVAAGPAASTGGFTVTSVEFLAVQSDPMLRLDVVSGPSPVIETWSSS